MREVFWTLLLLFAGSALLLLLALVAARTLRALRDERVTARKAEVRTRLLTALLGEPDETEEALADLCARTGRAWACVEEQAFAMLPKIKGDARVVLVDLLVRAGAAERAHANARARSLVRRGHGAYQLGALGDPAAVPVLIGVLADRRFLVRRVAVRALGQVGDPAAVPALLDAVVEDTTLTRDVVNALRRIGSPAAVPLRAGLVRGLDEGPPDRRAALAATGLGLLGDVAAIPLLLRALAAGDQPALPAAAAEAIGLIGAPEAVPGLVAAVGSADHALRAAAARALGRVGDPAAVGGLAHALDGASRESDRAVAAALLQLGADGHRALRAHSSPYAREALAVHALRTAPALAERQAV